MQNRRTAWFSRGGTAICMLLLSDLVLSQSFEPARLIDLDDRVDLGCPNPDPSGTTFFCKVVVSAEGHAEDVEATHCFSIPWQAERLGRNLRRKLLRSEFAPARIDGDGVRVNVPFRAVLRPALQMCEVTIIPNLGFQQEELGPEYVSPQELLADGGWLVKLASEDPQWGITAGLVFVMSVAVSESGQASDGMVEVEPESEDSTVRQSVISAVRSLETSVFIPAFVEGEPRQARYVDYLVLPPN